MTVKSIRSFRAMSADILPDVQAKGLALAADTLPKIADAAHRAGDYIGRASSAAGEQAARRLRAIEPSEVGKKVTKSASQNAATLGRLLAPVLFFAKRRPVAFAIGGLVIAGAGMAMWRRTLKRNEDMDKSGKEIGEGSYAGARDYKDRTKAFLSEKGEAVDQLAHEAEDALEGGEAAALKAAEEQGRKHARH